MTRPAITLLNSTTMANGISWTDDTDRIGQVSDFDQIVSAVGRRSHEFRDIERIIIEGAIDSLDYLMFLSTLPADFKSDVVLIDRADHAFLSAVDGGGLRVMFDLEQGDIEFYLDVNGLRKGTADRARLIAAAMQADGNRERLRALVADDDAKTREFLSAALNDLGCEVRLAKTGTEAVSIAAEWRPHMLLLDGLMPQMGGFDVARFVRHLDVAYRPRIVIATGVYKNTRYRNEARLKYGVDDYLVKPVTADQLGKALFGKTASDFDAMAVA